jgi:hypothetical protein
MMKPAVWTGGSQVTAGSVTQDYAIEAAVPEPTDLVLPGCDRPPLVKPLGPVAGREDQPKFAMELAR